MNSPPQHPAVEAYRRLRRQTEGNPAWLQFAVLQQVWLDVRSETNGPSEYGLVLNRAMSYAQMVAQGFSEQEIRGRLVDLMSAFEAEFQRQFRVQGHAATPTPGESPSKSNDRQPAMRRTRWPGNIVSFPQRKQRE